METLKPSAVRLGENVETMVEYLRKLVREIGVNELVVTISDQRNTYSEKKIVRILDDALVVCRREYARDTRNNQPWEQGIIPFRDVTMIRCERLTDVLLRDVRNEEARRSR